MCLHMLLGRVLGMLVGMGVMRMSKLRMVRSPEVIARFMVLGGFRVMVCSQSVVMGGLFMVLRCFFRHRESPFLLAGLAGSKHEWNFYPAGFGMGYGAFN